MFRYEGLGIRVRVQVNAKPLLDARTPRYPPNSNS